MSKQSTSDLGYERQRREIDKLIAEIQQIERGHEFEVRRWKAGFWLKVVALLASVFGSVIYFLSQEVFNVGGC